MSDEQDDIPATDLARHLSLLFPEGEVTKARELAIKKVIEKHDRGEINLMAMTPEQLRYLLMAGELEETKADETEYIN